MGKLKRFVKIWLARRRVNKSIIINREENLKVVLKDAPWLKKLTDYYREETKHEKA